MRWLTDHTPQLVLIPTIAVTIAYVILFSVWTLWMSVSNSTLLPDTTYAGFGEYVRALDHAGAGPSPTRTCSCSAAST